MGERGKKKEEDSRKWRTWLVKNHGQFRDNQLFPRFLRCSSKRAVRERRSTTSHPPRFSLTFYFENGRNFLPHPPLTCPPTSSTPSPILRLHPQTQRLPWKNSREDEERARRGIAWKQTREIKARHWRSLDGADYFYDVTRRRDGCPEDEMPQPPSISKEEEEEKSFAGRPLRCRWQLLPPPSPVTGIPSPASVSAPPFIPRLSYVIIRSWRPDELMDIGWGWVGYREGRRYVTWDQRGSNGVRENSGDLGYSSSYGYYRLEFFIFFFFWKVGNISGKFWIRNFVYLFDYEDRWWWSFLMYRNNSGERVLRIIRKRRKKNGRSK